MAMPSDQRPPRTRWPPGFPSVVIHAPESSVKKHADYWAAKRGDADAALRLVQATLSADAVGTLRGLIGNRRPTLVSAHALEREGVNAIPEALADELARLLTLAVDSSVVQTNVVSHTGADGFSRMARQAAFTGDIVAGTDYVLVDDFVGQGGTLANLRGIIEAAGGHVIAATALTGKPHSAVLSPTAEQLALLRAKHGQELEIWWNERFGHSFDCLTQSEARYLERTQDADTVRNRIAEAEQAGNRDEDSGAAG
ncbi:MAG TPA: phosphoribosyltransferase [Casimicrobium huifangae]|nr:phosphoribosyltransferase [Casimicrobium huifangae]